MSRACTVIYGAGPPPGTGPGTPGEPSVGTSDIDNVLTAEMTLWRGGVYQQGYTNTLISYGGGLGVAQTSAASGVKSDETGMYTLFRAAFGVNGNFSGYFTSANLPWTTPNGLWDYVWVLKTGALGADILGVRIWLWLTSEIFPAGFTDTDSGAANVVGFRYSTVAGDLNWMSYTSNPAGLFTIKDTGVTVVPDTRYILRAHIIQVDPTYIIQFSVVSSAEHPGRRSSVLDVTDMKTIHDTLDNFPSRSTGQTAMFSQTVQVAGSRDIWFRAFGGRSL